MSKVPGAMPKSNTGTSGTGTGNLGMQILEFRREAGRDPSNIDDVVENWDRCLISDYGMAGVFIKLEKYFEEPMPAAPDMRGLDQSSLEYEIKKKDHMDLRANIAKDNRKLVALRPSIFNDMWGHCTEDTKARIRCQEGFADVETARDDPLKLMVIIRAAMVAAPRGDEVVTLLEARAGLQNLVQAPTMRLGEYKRLFLVKVARLVSLGDSKPSEAIQAAMFLQNLDKRRFATLHGHIRQKVLKRPETLEAAYDMAWGLDITRGEARDAGGESERSYHLEGTDEDPEIALLADAVAKRLGNNARAAPAKAPKTKSASKKVKFEKDTKVGDDGEPAGSKKGAARNPPAKDSFRHGTCKRCGKFGHFIKDCRKAASVEELAMVAEEEDDDEFAAVCVGAGCDPDDCAMIGADIVRSRLATMHSFELGIDTMCSNFIFGEKRLVHNIQECEPRTFQGIGGKAVVRHIAQHVHPCITWRVLRTCFPWPWCVTWLMT